jgi:hypothetical protein
MQTHDYLTLAASSLRQKVLAPLARFGIEPQRYLGSELDAIAPSAGAAPNAELAA